MNLRQLEYFLAIVEHGGVHRASEVLHVAQSSLSQTLRALEKSLGVQLFHRVGRGIVLSPAGEGFVGPARAVLREADNARRAVADIGEVRSGRLDIASLSDLVTDPVATWISSFLMGHPGVHVRVEQDADGSEVSEMVRSGACELGFLSVPGAGDLEHVKLVEQEYVLLCPPGSEDEWPETVPIAALRDEAFVLGEKGSSGRDYLESVLREHGVEPRIAVEANQREAVVPLVLSGCVVGIAPVHLAVNFQRRGGVVRELDPAPRTPIYMVKRPGDLSPGAAAFVAAARRSLQYWIEAVEDNPERDRIPLVDRAALALRNWDTHIRERP